MAIYSLSRDWIAPHQYHTVKRSAKSYLLADICVSKSVMLEDADLVFKVFRYLAAAVGHPQIQSVTRESTNRPNALEFVGLHSIAVDMNVVSVVVLGRRRLVSGKLQSVSTGL